MMTDEKTRERNRYVREYFKGDWGAYDADVAEGTRYTLSWDSIATTADVLPDLDMAAEKTIIRLLGYLPPPEVILPHAPFIRGVLAKNGITEETRETELATHVRHIRNDDLRKGGWDRAPEGYRETVYERRLTPFRSAARQRLIRLLGYDPDLPHSMVAEVLLRELCARDNYCASWEPTPYDFKALTIVRFSEVQASAGPEAADRSPLLIPEHRHSQSNPFRQCSN